MLYKFKSPAASDLIMLEPHGRLVLRIIGKNPAEPPAPPVPGILQPADMPAAISALEAAVAHDEAQRTQQALQAQEDGADAPTPTEAHAIHLRQRVAPFVALLKRCHAADENIVWGV